MAMFSTRAALYLVFAAPILAHSAQADANLNCSAYAGFAVSQQEQNIAQNCGFSGGGWSADFNAHFQWCQLDNVKMVNLTTEDNARKAALQQCAQAPLIRQAECQGYAANAVLDSRLSFQAVCGLTGGRWSEDYAGHFDWCLTVDLTTSTFEAAARNNQLAGCLTAKQTAKETGCRAYAETAVLQNEENQQKNCGFSGGAWSNNTTGHYDWCMGASDAAHHSEAINRNNALRDSCIPKATKTHCWTETKARVGIPPWTVVRHCKSI